MVGEIGSKAISAFNSVEVEVEAELGKNTANIKMTRIATNIEHKP